MKKSLKSINYLLMACVIILAIASLWHRRSARQEETAIPNGNGKTPVENAVTKEDEESGAEVNLVTGPTQKENDPRKQRTKSKQEEDEAIMDEIQLATPVFYICARVRTRRH